jgi:hypothetical protein
MRQTPRRFVDLVEAAPDLWAIPSEVDQVRAAQTAIPDLTSSTRRRTPHDVPALGDAAEFFAIVIALLVVAFCFGG